MKHDNFDAIESIKEHIECNREEWESSHGAAKQILEDVLAQIRYASKEVKSENH